MNSFHDVWSLGCTVFEMLTGNPPWHNEESKVGLLMKITFSNGVLEYPENISAELLDFLQCCFQIEPSNRANVFELLQHPFIQRKSLGSVKTIHLGVDSQDKSASSFSSVPQDKILKQAKTIKTISDKHSNLLDKGRRIALANDVKAYEMYSSDEISRQLQGVRRQKSSADSSSDGSMSKQPRKRARFVRSIEEP